MKRHLQTARAALAAIFLLACTHTAAYDVKFKPGGQTLAGMLDSEASLHLHALQKALQLPRHANFVNDERLMGELREHTVSSTVARVEYRYYGASAPRVYHARSGRSVAGTIRWLSTPKPESGSSSGSGKEWVQELQDDMNDKAFYPHMGPNEIRVPSLPRERSKLFANDPMRKRDAELKALRALDADLSDLVVPPGGTLDIFVSQAPCSSCEQAINQFSDKHKMRTVVHYLEGRNQARNAPKSANQVARSSFFEKRKADTKAALTTGRVRAPTLKDEKVVLEQLKRAEDFESGRLKVGEAACVP